jgi:hypothetical protein
MDCQIEVQVKDTDARSSQFSCELIVTNRGDEEFEVASATVRLPPGLKVNEALNPSDVQANLHYARVCRRIEDMVSTYLITASAAQTEAHVDQLRKAVRKLLSWRGLLSAYVSLVLLQMPNFLRKTRESLIRLRVTSLRQAEAALELLGRSGADEVDLRAVEYWVNVLREIAHSDEFQKKQLAGSVVRKNEQYKTTYIIDARRGWFDTRSYSVNVDVMLRTSREKREIFRRTGALVSVTPSSLSLTALAILTALVGATIGLVAGADRAPRPEAFVENWGGYLVAALTAAIVFNIFDFTNLRDRFQARVSWRSAILVGFVCGYLNDRILDALQALLG